MSLFPDQQRESSPVCRLPMLWLLLLAAIFAGGCLSRGDRWSGERPPVYEVSGRVTLDGQPLAGAEVNYYSEAGKRTAYGVTDDRGYFDLTTFETRDGALAGTHQVKVRKVQIIAHDDPNIDYASSLETAPPPETKWLTPKKYGDYATSGLTAVVTADGANEPLLELRSN